MADSLQIIDQLRDPQIYGIIKEHEQRLLKAGIEKLEIYPHPQAVDGSVSLAPGKRHGYWTGDPTPAKQAMEDLKTDMEANGIPSRIQNFKCECPPEIMTKRPFHAPSM